MLAVNMTIMTITVSYICSANSYCDNNVNNGRYICSANNYCDNNGEVYVQC
jgi:hypothetical protein